MPAEGLRVWHYSRDSASKVKWLFRCHACSLKIVSATQRQRFGSLVFCQSVDENVTAAVHADSEMAAVTQTDPKIKDKYAMGRGGWVLRQSRACTVSRHHHTRCMCLVWHNFTSRHGRRHPSYTPPTQPSQALTATHPGRMPRGALPTLV